jgi:hypothetical protein
MKKDKRKRVLAWLWVALCSLAIFLVVPIARTIQRFVSSRWGRSLFGYAVLASTAAVFLSLVYVLVFRLKIRRASNYVWLTAVAFLYIYFTLKLWRTPEQAVHFLEYGLLGYFLFRALSLSIRDRSIYAAAFLCGTLVGIVDEVLQWMIPNRYWDFGDVGLNALAVGLFQVAVWKGINPKIITKKVSPRSVRRVSVLLAVNLVVLGICASNTPRRVAGYAGRFPFLSFLLREEPMNEFSRRHADTEIGVFYSRLSLEEIKETDAKSSDHYGQVLRDWKNKDYARFLSEHSPLIHPFLYEMRVHIFRRDRKETEAEKAKNEKSRREALFIAAKENRILEKYFTRTLQKSSYAWSAEKERRIEAGLDLSRPYRSPVSAGVFHVKEGTVWLMIVLVLAALAGLNLAYPGSRRLD